MPVNFIPFDRNALDPFPPTVQDDLLESQLARFVVEIVEQLDLSPLIDAYSGRGSPPYHPAMLLALLFYGYATGVFSSRKPWGCSSSAPSASTAPRFTPTPASTGP